MGNRILAACTAILYGEIANREVVIDWRDRSYSEAGENAFSKFFNCPTAASVDELPDNPSIYPELWQGNLDVTLGNLQSQLKLKGFADMSFDPSKVDYAADILVFCAYTHKINSLRPLFQNDFSVLKQKTNREILRSILETKLHLVDAINQSIQNFKDSHFSNQVIGVHVRYTDIKIPLEKILAKVQKVVDKHSDPVIFLATDSQKVMGDFQGRFPKVVTAHKWFPPDGERMHQNWDRCPDRYQNGVEALTDLFLLSECSSLIFSSQSSFGYVASLLSKANPKEIFDVEIEDSVWRRLQRKSKTVLQSLKH
ncbi:nodulation protein NodZ [Oscillatoria sp. CS-180]|uniref:nodulation protein NodZ n=1 Tax=Oscillatoria sp. CS-180 TaxID=3021720 RepID=UPI00232D8065|nr:nodulation protein NodZ [Oscillatoria sp. CS-180]MDB9528862.1 nodulation protein NodZ [Oscillatoria sp. CS-180]